MAAGTAVTGGVGGTTFGALSSIGSDLSVSVSFNIARELLSAAADEQINEDELIGLVLGFTIVFSALQSRLSSELEKRRVRSVESAKKDARSRVLSLRAQLTVSNGHDSLLIQKVTDEFEQSFLSEAGRVASEKLADRRSILDFLFLLISICQRITVAISVQLLAASVRAQQPSRFVRTVSLVGLASFFVFVESLTHRRLV
tara:strand:+ start:3480 stop:4082 length:603 start_codon:yes stop_codon:yes gene_type:complete